MQRCAGCKGRFFCSRACQSKDWPSHRGQCRSSSSSSSSSFSSSVDKEVSESSSASVNQSSSSGGGKAPSASSSTSVVHQPSSSVVASSLVAWGPPRSILCVDLKQLSPNLFSQRFQNVSVPVVIKGTLLFVLSVLFETCEKRVVFREFLVVAAVCKLFFCGQDVR
jgi:hypothetical protein